MNNLAEHDPQPVTKEGFTKHLPSCSLLRVTAPVSALLSLSVGFYLGSVSQTHIFLPEVGFGHKVGIAVTERKIEKERKKSEMF